MGMGGVQRTAKFVKYLPDSGWKPFVLTANPKSYFASDNSLLDELVKKNTNIFRTDSENETKIQSNGAVFKSRNESFRKFLSNVGQSFLIPDTKRFWKNKAVKLAKRIIDENDIKLIYAT